MKYPKMEIMKNVNYLPKRKGILIFFGLMIILFFDCPYSIAYVEKNARSTGRRHHPLRAVMFIIYQWNPQVAGFKCRSKIFMQNYRWKSILVAEDLIHFFRK